MSDIVSLMELRDDITHIMFVFLDAQEASAEQQDRFCQLIHGRHRMDIEATDPEVDLQWDVQFKGTTFMCMTRSPYRDDVTYLHGRQLVQDVARHLELFDIGIMVMRYIHPDQQYDTP